MPPPSVSSSPSASSSPQNSSPTPATSTSATASGNAGHELSDQSFPVGSALKSLVKQNSSGMSERNTSGVNEALRNNTSRYCVHTLLVAGRGGAHKVLVGALR